jgi:tetratricopeptide (TPR) repeat protein
MKKLLLMVIFIAVIVCVLFAVEAEAYNFGDFRSETLTTKAWQALEKKDTEGVLAYTNKCLELYAEQAKKMQASLSDYPKGDNEKIFSYWALNDVATCLFIQGEAYRRADMKNEAIAVFKKVMDEYSYGQSWDKNGWFWKPASAAKEKLAMLDSGSTLDFGDYTSAFILGQAWKVLGEGNYDVAITYCDKIFEMYEVKASEMQASLTEYPWQSREQIFKYWALNDVGTALYVKGEALKNLGKNKEAKESYQKLIKGFFYAQCWDPAGWFWKPAEAAQEAADAISDN